MGSRFNHVSLALLLAAGVPSMGRLEAQTAPVRGKVADAVPFYKPAVPVKGAVEIPCTDVLADVAEAWNQGFRKFQPEANLVMLPRLDTEAVKDLQNGKYPLVIINREFTAAELKAFTDKYGYPPLRIMVGLDAIIVFVNAANPIKFLSMKDLDAIYSKTRLGGSRAPALTWGDVGVHGELAKRTINAYARAEGSGSRTTFGSRVLLNGEFRPGIIERADSSSLAEAVSNDLAGIAFGPRVSWFAVNKTLAVLPYADSDSDDSRFPTQETVANAKYPMACMFYAYLNHPPTVPVDPAIHEVLRFITAQEGQNEAADAGLLPGVAEFMARGMTFLDPKLDPKFEPKPDTRMEPKAEPKAETKAETKAEPRPAGKS